mmetsp:Transcript_1611/g.3451  ORF Transcript_1611/g.3451 Transcript_1611/m.3451 type:complete len:463 (-) Transcript_1611:32-1420(-)
MSISSKLGRRRRRGKSGQEQGGQDDSENTQYDNDASASIPRSDTLDASNEAVANAFADAGSRSTRSSRSGAQQQQQRQHVLTSQSSQSSQPSTGTDTDTDFVPPTPPSTWPHRPLLIRPSPDSSMRIIGIRYSSSTTSDYLPEYCDCTSSLPINIGTEDRGKCLVADFETELFVGTVLFRIKLRDRGNSGTLSGMNPQPSSSRSYCNCYFTGKKRTFQAVIRGKFRQTQISMSDCITGQIFRHSPMGTKKKLPPKWILHGAVSVFKALAPQLTVDFDGRNPKFLSPLVSTAQTVLSRDIAGDSLGISMEDAMVEPYPTDSQSLHQDLLKCNNIPLPLLQPQSLPTGTSKSVQSRIKARKKAFDKNYARRQKTPYFDTSKEYTFEFFQHLLHFDDFSVDLGKVGGKHRLAGVLHGLPLKCMAARYDPRRDDRRPEYLWNFDIWHESCYDDAIARARRSREGTR